MSKVLSLVFLHAISIKRSIARANKILLIGRVRKNSDGKRQAYYQSQEITGKLRSLSALVPLSLTTQVCHQ